MGNRLKMYVDIMSCHYSVTGSCFLCVVKLPTREKVKFIIDCGLFQEKDFLYLNSDFPFDCDDIAFALITHNHVDHVGRLPLLVRKGFRGNIYTSKETAHLLPISLYDSQKVLSEASKRKHEKILYSINDVSETLSQICGIEYNKKNQITPNIAVTFLKNAHILGAVMIFVEITFQNEEPINLLFTGDYAKSNDFFDTCSIPDDIRNKMLNVIIESTYGETSIKDIKYGAFKEKLLESVKTKKKIIIPVLSLGRSQQILYEIKKMQDSGELDIDIPIFFDGNLAQEYTRIYLREDFIKEEMKDFLPKNLTWVYKENREQVVNYENVKIIVTTSGMGTYGPAQIYIPRYISDVDTVIIFTCYTAEDTVGARLKNTENGRAVELNGLVKKKLADVFYTNEFSSHAKVEELMEFLNQFNNLKTVIVNHGETETKLSFAKKVFDDVNSKNVGIISRDYLFRLGPYGVDKTFTTKF